MEILTATMTMAGDTFDVEVISEFRGYAEVLAIGCHPFLHGASYAIVRSDDLTNRRVEGIPADLPLAADPSDDEPLPVEITDDAAYYRQVNDLQQWGRGA